MRKRFIGLLLIFVLLISMTSFVLAEDEGKKDFDPKDFTLQAIHQEWKESIDEYPMVLTLTNKTDKDVTVTGDENNQLTIWIKTWPGASEKEAFKFDLYAKAKEITVKAGKTEKIVEVPAGAPGSWQTFYPPQLVTGMDLEVTVDGEKGEFTDIYYAITGIIRNPLYVGEIIPTDNEDGTVTFKFDLLAFDEEAEIVRKADVKPERPCQPGYEDMEHCITKMEVKKSGPKTGLKKSDFAVIDEYGQVIGDILQAKEIAEGKYEVVWQHEAGEYEGLKLNTAAGYGDFYVCYFPKDDDGNYRVNESHLSEYEFKATITHTKDPIVIEHEEATLETVGATNIPKLVDLYFKEVTEEIAEDTMALFKKNAEDTAVKREIVHIYDISLLVGGVEIQPDGNVKITIPLSEKMKKYVDLKVVYFTETGEAKEVEAYEVTDTAISFITNHFSYYAVLGTPQEAIEETGEEETDGAVPESPKTGDSAIHYAFFIGIMALMVIGIVLKKEYGR